MSGLLSCLGGFLVGEVLDCKLSEVYIVVRYGRGDVLFYKCVWWWCMIRGWSELYLFGDLYMFIFKSDIYVWL